MEKNPGIELPLETNIKLNATTTPGSELPTEVLGECPSKIREQLVGINDSPLCIPLCASITRLSEQVLKCERKEHFAACSSCFPFSFKFAVGIQAKRLAVAYTFSRKYVKHYTIE